MRARVNGRVRVRSFDGACVVVTDERRTRRARKSAERGGSGPSRAKEKKLLEKAIAAAGRVSNIVTMTVIT